MNVASYENLDFNETFYEEVNVSSLKFDGEYLAIEGSTLGDIYITPDIRDSFSKFVGMSSSIDESLYNTDKDLWYKVLTKLYKYYSKESIILLIESDESGKCKIKGLCNTNFEPITTKDFIDSVIRFYEDVENTSVYEISCDPSSVESSVIVLDDSNSYHDTYGGVFKLGVVFRNDELGGTYCRMAIVYNNGVIYYLPSKQYNLTRSRYERTSDNSKEALESLLLRVSEDFTLTNLLSGKSDDYVKYIKSANDKHITRSEYETIYTVIMNQCAISDFIETDVQDISEMLSELDDYEKLYGSIRSEYLWKCTAIGGTTLYKLLDVVSSILTRYTFYPESLDVIRDTLGDFLINPRVCQLLAKSQS